jgi:hypothetical protein
MTGDFRDLDVRLRATVFLEELNRLMDLHGFHIGCCGYECEGLELYPEPPHQRFKLPDIKRDWAQPSVTLETE